MLPKFSVIPAQNPKLIYKVIVELILHPNIRNVSFWGIRPRVQIVRNDPLFAVGMQPIVRNGALNYCFFLNQQREWYIP